MSTGKKEGTKERAWLYHCLEHISNQSIATTLFTKMSFNSLLFRFIEVAPISTGHSYLVRLTLCFPYVKFFVI